MFDQNTYYFYDDVETVIYEEKGYKILVVNNCINNNIHYEVTTPDGYVTEVETFQQAIDIFNKIVF